METPRFAFLFFVELCNYIYCLCTNSILNHPGCIFQSDDSSQERRYINTCPAINRNMHKIDVKIIINFKADNPLIFL